MRLIFRFTVCFVFLLLSFFVCSKKGLAEVNQKFEGFNLQGYTKEGDKAWDVNGTSADILGDKIEITNVDANQYGQETVNLKAKTGTIDKASGNVNLQEDVVITSQRGSKLITDSLDWDKEQDLITTEDSVVINDDAMVATGTGLKAQPGLKTVEMKQDVTVKVNPEKKPAQKAETITITCDGPLEIDQRKNVAVLNNNVVAIQTDRILKADLMEVYFDPETQKIKQIICVGNVFIKQGDNTSQSKKAIYNAESQKMILSGRPKLIFQVNQMGGMAPGKD